MNAPDGRAALSRLLGVSPAAITRDVAVLRRAQALASTIAVRRVGQLGAVANPWGSFRATPACWREPPGRSWRAVSLGWPSLPAEARHMPRPLERPQRVPTASARLFARFVSDRYLCTIFPLIGGRGAYDTPLAIRQRWIWLHLPHSSCSQRHSSVGARGADRGEPDNKSTLRGAMEAPSSTIPKYFPSFPSS